MKSIKFYAIIASLVFITASCVENSSKYKALITQRDSMERVNQALDSNYNKTLVVLNDIENGFSEINQNETQMKLNLKGVEGSKTNIREVIGAQMKAIKDGIEQNKAKIAELRQLAAKRGKANNMLTQTINRLQNEINKKGVQIDSLQAVLEQRNIKITELNTTVDVQSKNISEQQNVLEQQKSTIKTQEENINTVWFCIASSNKLKDSKIISGGGLFQAKKVMSADFDKSIFTQGDMRNITSIPTNKKSIKIISTHPLNSYKLVTGADKSITIEILNPSKFWSISKYLVVQI